MRAAIFNGPHDITVGDRPDPVIEEATDAIVRVTLACVCGSDLWYYRGQSPHDLGRHRPRVRGRRRAVGTEVRGVDAGALVVAPFTWSRRNLRPCAAPAGPRTA